MTGGGSGGRPVAVLTRYYHRRNHRKYGLVRLLVAVVVVFQTSRREIRKIFIPEISKDKDYESVDMNFVLLPLRPLNREIRRYYWVSGKKNYHFYCHRTTTKTTFTTTKTERM